MRRVSAALSLGLAASSLALLGGCSAPGPAHYVSNPIGELPLGSFGRAWLADLPVASGDELSRMVVDGDTLYVFSKNAGVVSINRTAGTINFLAHINSPSPRLLNPVALADRLVFPTAVSLEVYDKTGHFLRSVLLHVPLRSGAAGVGDVIYFGADDPDGGRLVAEDLSRSFSTVRWELLTPGGSITGAPAVFAGNIYVGTEAGTVYAVNSDRASVWNTDKSIFTVGDRIVADLKTDAPGTKADDANLYIACMDTKLYAVSALTGKLHWQYYAGVPLSSPPVICADMVYQEIPGEGVAAIDKTDPRFNRLPRWTYHPATRFLSQDDTYAYLLEPRTVDAGKKFPFGRKTRMINVIVAVDKKTGRLAFESNHTDFAIFGTNNTDSLIYAGYSPGEVLAIKPVLKAGQVGEMVMAKPGAEPTVVLADAASGKNSIR
jgi:hypothetical protein